MNKILTTSLVAIALAVSACGGGEECSHLSETCAKCTDATQKAACQSIVTNDVEESCEAAHASYDALCT